MSLNQRAISLDSPVEWRQALTGIPHMFGHTWENCHGMYLTTGLKTFLYSYEDEHARIVCPVAEREHGGYRDIVKPFGFSGFVGTGTSPEFPQQWKNFVRERGYVCGYLGINPIFDCSSLFDPCEVQEYDTIYALDLTQNPDQLLANMAKGRKQQLKDWQSTSAHFVFDEGALEEFLLKTYADFLRSRNASSAYFFSGDTISFLLSSENVKVMGVEQSGKVVAANAIAYTQDVADGLFNVSLPEGRHFSVATIWYYVKFLQERSVPFYNLGGGGEGLADFKRRFGCTEFPLKCLKQVYEPRVYEMLCREAAADPSDRGGFFPAYY